MLAINSWESPAEVDALEQLAPGRLVLELGGFEGFSAILMALSGAEHVHSVDWHRGDGVMGERDSLCTMWRNLERFGVQDRVTMHVGRTEVVLPMLVGLRFDLLFVDGDHEAAVRDTELSLRLVRPGGQVVWHDRERWQVPAAIRYAEDFMDQRHRVLAGQLAVMDIPEF